MNLLLIRECEPSLTLGKLYIGDVWECHTLEDKDRRLESGGVKVKGETAIPTGTYRITVDYSNRFKRRMIHVLDVPQFAGIRIHAGNTTADSEGCPLVGQAVRGNALVRSRAALNDLQAKVEAALHRNEQVWLTVRRK